MQARLHAIADRARGFDTTAATVADFTLDDGEAADPQIVIDQPAWKLYCLDPENRCAVFVELDEAIDLADAAFLRLTQFENARRVLTVPWEALEGLSTQVPLPERLILIFNTGRCGTTLASKVVNQADGVWSLSEPDVYEALAMKRTDSDRDELAGLVRACTRLLFRPPPGRSADTLAIKFRSQSLPQADLFHEVFPDAAFVFMYRDGPGWANSFARLFQNAGVWPRLEPDKFRMLWTALSTDRDTTYLERFVDDDPDGVPVDAFLAPLWTFYIEHYLSHLDKGVPFLAIRYNEFSSDREAVTAGLLAHCGLPASALEAAMKAFETDSQAGTQLARDRDAVSFSDENYERFRTTLARHPRFETSDMLLPDIRHPDRAA